MQPPNTLFALASSFRPQRLVFEQTPEAAPAKNVAEMAEQMKMDVKSSPDTKNIPPAELEQVFASHAAEREKVVSWTAQERASFVSQLKVQPGQSAKTLAQIKNLIEEEITREVTQTINAKKSPEQAEVDPVRADLQKELAELSKGLDDNQRGILEVQFLQLLRAKQNPQGKIEIADVPDLKKQLQAKKADIISGVLKLDDNKKTEQQPHESANGQKSSEQLLDEVMKKISGEPSLSNFAKALPILMAAIGQYFKENPEIAAFFDPKESKIGKYLDDKNIAEARKLIQEAHKPNATAKEVQTAQDMIDAVRTPEEQKKLQDLLDGKASAADGGAKDEKTETEKKDAEKLANVAKGKTRLEELGVSNVDKMANLTIEEFAKQNESDVDVSLRALHKQAKGKQAPENKNQTLAETLGKIPEGDEWSKVVKDKDEFVAAENEKIVLEGKKRLNDDFGLNQSTRDEFADKSVETFLAAKTSALDPDIADVQKYLNSLKVSRSPIFNTNKTLAQLVGGLSQAELEAAKQFN